MTRSTRGAVRFGAIMVTAAAALLSFNLASRADGYAGVPQVRSGDPASIGLDPYDPLPEIGFRCHHDCRHYDEYYRRHEHYPHRDRDDWYSSHHRGPWHGAWLGPDPNTALVDCSGRNRHAFRSVSEAALHTPPNGRILIVPPDPGMTCVETVHAFGPVTISSAGPGDAVIQAPAHQPCLIADIPLGDTLVVEGVKFIARGEDEPCVQVQAGAVTMRQVHVDSRNTHWAFNVQQSGTLSLTDSRIETDGSGVFASRATVHIHHTEIDVEEGKTGIGMALDRTDGNVDESQIIGGAVGAAVSAGPRGLTLSKLLIKNSLQALVADHGQQGVVTVQSLAARDNRDGILVAPGSDVRLTDIEVESTRGIAVALYGGRSALTASRIRGASIGVALAPPSAWHADFWDRLFHRGPAPRPDPSNDGPIPKGAEITGNEIAHVGFGFDLNDGGPAVIAGNRIDAHECFRGDGYHVERHDNSCHD